MTDLNIELAVARAAVVTLEAEIANDARQKLIAEHTSLADACRSARDEVRRLRSEANRLRDAFIHQRGELENAQRHLADWREGKPRDADYPTAATYDEWLIELNARQTTAAEVQRALAEATAAYQMARVIWQKAKDAFEGLADKESGLRSQLQPKRGNGITITAHDGVVEGARMVRAG